MKALSDYVRLALGDAMPLIAFKASAEVVSKLVTLLVTVAVARELSPHAFGAFALAMTSGWLLGVASDAGLSLYLARETARVVRDPAAVGAVFQRVMRVRAAFALATTPVVLVVIRWAPSDFVIGFLVIVAGQLVAAMLETVVHLFRGVGRSDLESRLVISHRLATAAWVGIALIASPTLLSVALAMAVPPVGALIVGWLMAQRFGAASGGAVPQHAAAPLRSAFPVGAGILLSALYFRCDVYFVEYWHGLDAVGVYNAVFRLIEALRLFPAAVLAVMFPVLCRATTSMPAVRLGVVLGTCGLLASAMIFVGATTIVDVIYGAAYRPAAPALQMLALALPLFFVNYALTHQVIGWDGQRAYLVITIVALITNLAANTLLIPTQGIVGAALATLVTEVSVLAGCVVALRTRLAHREAGAGLAVPTVVS